MVALKGAFLSFGASLLGALPNIVVFQFNPVEVTRTPTVAEFAPPFTDTGSINAREQASPPGESITFTVKVDASDQLAQKNKIAAASGILPMLSALELLMVPKSQLAINLVKLDGEQLFVPANRNAEHRIHTQRTSQLGHARR